MNTQSGTNYGTEKGPRKFINKYRDLLTLVADTDLDSSNPLFEILADWNEQLKHIDLESLDDPQAQSSVVEFEEPQP